MISKKLETQKNNLIEYVRMNVEDEIIKESIIVSFTEEFRDKIRFAISSRDGLIKIVAWYILSYNLRSIRIIDISWNLACNLYNTEYYSVLCNIEKVFSEKSEKTVLNSMKRSIESRKSFEGYYDYKDSIIRFYNYLFSKMSLKYANIDDIKYYKELLINEYSVKFSDVNIDFKFSELHKKVLNNMPINSDYRCFIQKEYLLTKNNVLTKINFDCRTKNKFIKELINGFINEVYKTNKAPHNRDLKIFTYYFMDSIGHFKLNNYLDINFKLLRRQFKYFNNLSLSGTEVDAKLIKEYITLFIIQFYRYILSNNETAFTKLETYATKCKLIRKVLEEDYEVILLNPNENIPEMNKFCVIQNEYTMFNASKSNKNFFVDLSGIDSITQRDIKEYVWYSRNIVEHRFDSIHIILSFLEFKDEYYRFYYKEKRYENKYRYKVDVNVLYLYMEKINEEYSKNNTKKYVISQLRRFLKFYKDKYDMKENYFEILSLKGLNDYDGGTPITEHDLKIIYGAIKNEEEDNPKVSIYKIVFELSLLTNLRIGEIICLERDCIVNNNVLRYLSKTSQKNYKEQPVNEEIIMLINKAIELTKNLVDDSFMSKYIFIEKSYTNFSERIKKIEFYIFFKKIISKVSNELENTNYTPYNLRHTFIDTVYKEGVKNNLPLSKIALIAGNSFSTAKKHYRKWNDYEMYVETLSKVKITDTSIIGEIFSKETDLNNPVRDNLGSCKEKECTFDFGECLICKHFITFTNRIDVFENRIKKINKYLEECNDVNERGVLIYEKKLLSKYLLEMLKIKEGENNND